MTLQVDWESADNSWASPSKYNDEFVQPLQKGKVLPILERDALVLFTGGETGEGVVLVEHLSVPTLGL